MRHIFFLSMLVLFGCKQAPTDAIGVSFGHEFTLKVGQQAVLDGEQLTIVFEKVLDDSRCPTGSICVWEGNARVAIKLLKSGDGGKNLELNTTVQPKKDSFLHYEVGLKRLDPYPSTEELLDTKNYRASFIVSKM